jgi:hypothetical protein
LAKKTLGSTRTGKAMRLFVVDSRLDMMCVCVCLCDVGIVVGKRKKEREREEGKKKSLNV